MINPQKYIIENSFKQHDPEWYAARVGSIGGTDFKSIVTSTGKISGSRDKQLIITAEEILTGVKRPFYPSYDMKVGSEREPAAIKLFSDVKRWDVEECAMIWGDERKRWHVSPDFIMPAREEGGETKCRSLAVFREHFKAGVLPTGDRVQVQQSLAVTGWKIWWYVSYFPGLKPLIIPVKRDEKLIDIFKTEMERFVKDLDELLIELRS